MKVAMSTVVAKAGGAGPLADFLGVSTQIVYIWIARGWFPPERARQIERKYKVPRIKLVNSKLAKLLAD